MDIKRFTDIVEWQQQTFPGATSLSKVEHLKEEVNELAESIESNDTKRALEFADCILLIYGAAAADGMTYHNIMEAIDFKMSINRNRKWGKPDEKGVVKHIPS